MYFTSFPFSFSCLEYIESLPVISWFWKCYFPIWVLPIFSTHLFFFSTHLLIHPRYEPDTIIINWNMRNICTHSWCLFLYGIFSCIALHITWKPCHVQCGDIFKFWICANYIYIISFFFLFYITYQAFMNAYILCGIW